MKILQEILINRLVDYPDIAEIITHDMKSILMENNNQEEEILKENRKTGIQDQENLTVSQKLRA